MEEVKLGCTLAMLLCLDRDHRLPYILGEILEFDHNGAARIAGTTPAAYRQRLSTAMIALITDVLARSIDSKSGRFAIASNVSGAFMQRDRQSPVKSFPHRKRVMTMMHR